jgi:hypothetical protein
MEGQGKRRRTRHFRIEDWLDFARGLVAVEESARMRAHAEGCPACRETMTFVGKLAKATVSHRTPPLPALPKRAFGKGGA